MWKIISNISSICSILGLPLALWQICSIKSKIESTEKGIKNILDIKEHEELNRIFTVLEKEYAELSDLITQINKPGKTSKSSNEKCCAINREIGNCIVMIPPRHNDILENFNKTMEHIENFVESDMKSNVELKEARDYLNNALQKVKKEQKLFESKEVHLASHNNE